MQHSDFLSRWKAIEEREALAPGTSFLQLNSSVELAFPGIEWLKQVGVPSEAAPYLSFEEASTLPFLWQIFSPGRWSSAEMAKVAAYRMLGSDGSGNPICVMPESGAVMHLDHEDFFTTRLFMNSSIELLAHYLLAFLEHREAEVLEPLLTAIEPAAILPGTFWHGELGNWRAGAG